jgi:hypothetical protein
LKPRVSLSLYSPSRRETSQLIECEMFSTKDAGTGLHAPVVVRVARSFQFLQVEVEANVGARARALHSGQNENFQARGSSLTLIVPLESDLEVHSLSILIDTEFAIWFIVEVCHFYQFDKNRAAYLLAAKWPFWSYRHQLDSWRSLFSTPSGRVPYADFYPRRLSLGLTANALEQRVLFYQAALRLLQKISRARKGELLADFASTERSGVDVAATIQLLKANPKFLVEKPGGPIRIRGAFYTTLFQEFGLQDNRRTDLSVVAALLAHIRHQAGRTDLPVISLELLERSRMLIRNLSDVWREHPRKQEIRDFLSAEMSSLVGERIKSEMAQLLALIKLGFERREHNADGFGGLPLGKRDFNIFEDLVYAGICLALGYQREIIQKRPVKMFGLRHHVIDVNGIDGASHLNKVLKGWRKTSAQRADYEPDFVVLYNGTIPLIVDAKFRIGGSMEEIAESGALKEVQAYLDEFSLASAIIVVPLIPSSLTLPSPQFQIIEGQSGSVHKRICVVEMPDCSDATFHANFREALRACAV